MQTKSKKDTISTDELARLVGVTSVTIHRYAEAGVFGSDKIRPGSGGWRRYDLDDVLVASVLVELGSVLSNRGATARGLPGAVAGQVASLVRRAEGRWLAIRHADEIEATDYLDMTTGAMLVVDLASIRGRLRAALIDLEKA